ncbi:MAG: hypothetical protein NTX27_21680 [Verrucomicrobia bacterium]|nr:hypothetical protein [Verrucomicrobiota bacterium]
MKKIILSLLAGLAVCGASGPYSIDGFKIAGGGGKSSGGTYSVSGTIGQPDAGAMRGGTFTLTGGFWALPVAVQSTDSPTLLITGSAPGLVTISWAPATPGFVLQVSDTLTPPAWINALSGTTNPISISATLPARFYRVNRR